MRILHILDHSIPLQSGYSFRTLSILREQRAIGWETLHLTSGKHDSSGEQLEEVDGLRFFRTVPRRHPLDRLPVCNQWAVVRDLKERLSDVVESEAPDILHAHSPCLTGLAALSVGRRVGLPVVYEMRASWEDAAVTHGTTSAGSPRYRLSKMLETHVLRRADAVTTICEGLRREIVGRGVPESKVTVIPNAVDPRKFPFEPEPDKGRIAESGFSAVNQDVLGFIGSFYSYEGLDVLLRALPEIVARRPSAHLLLVGGGPEDARLRSLAAELGLADSVTFIGRVSHDLVGRYYDAVDLLVYPRLATRLTEMVTPLKPLEAMAQGRLVAASDVGGHRELIRDGVTGTLFRPGDTKALAEAVAKTFESRERWPPQRLAARKFVEEERTWQRVVARYAPLYDSLLA